MAQLLNFPIERAGEPTLAAISAELTRCKQRMSEALHELRDLMAGNAHGEAASRRAEAALEGFEVPHSMLTRILFTERGGCDVWLEWARGLAALGLEGQIPLYPESVCALQRSRKMRDQRILERVEALPAMP